MNKIISVLYFIGAFMVLVGSSVYITRWIYAPYIYTVGAGFFALAQINSPYRGANKNIKRLRRQQIIGAIFLVLTGLFMFTTRHNEWIASLTIAAVFEIYTVFRISQEEKKEETP
jgi:predicted metal-binding membrane protein